MNLNAEQNFVQDARRRGSKRVAGNEMKAKLKELSVQKRGNIHKFSRCAVQK